MTEVTGGPFGPITLEPADLDALEEFTGLDRAACVERLATTDLAEMAREWHAAAPADPGEIRAFYETTDEYVWELLAWNLSEEYDPYRELVDRVAAAVAAGPSASMLDHGCGIASAALAFARRGFAVTLADVPGRTLEFAQVRLRHHGVPFEVFEVREDVPDFGRARFDAITSFDVLEHVTHPLEVAAALRAAVRPRGVAAIVASFDHRPDVFPHHLPEHQERFGGHRWEMYLRGIGWVPRGGHEYRPAGGARRAVERLRFAAWRMTGLHVEHRPG